MRTNLKVLRVRHKLSQEQMSEKMGVTRGTYSAIENGQRTGSRGFWNKLQETFEIPNEKMWELMACDEE